MSNTKVLRIVAVTLLLAAPGLARISHRHAAAARDAPVLASFSRLRVLQPTPAPSGPHAFGVAALMGGARGPYGSPSPTPRPSGRKRHHHRRLPRLASRGGEICGLATGQEPAWELSFKTFSGRFILAEPIWTRVAVTNASGKEVPRAGLYGDLYLDGAKKACRPVAGPNRGPETIPGGEGDSSRPAAPAGEEVSAWLNLSYECNLTRGGASPVGSHSVCYRDNASTDLLPSSACVSFEIGQPEGVDKEAFEAFGHNPLGHSERWGELLRRFPTSTYAAYVVWEYGAKGIASMSVDNLVSYAAGGTDLLGNSVPDASGSWRSYSGETFLEWRDGWFNLILKNHPQVWLGDEMRFVGSLDRYLQGDKDACAAGFADLAEHGKPYVAAKAKDLLSAMRAKGMLPEKGK